MTTGTVNSGMVGRRPADLREPGQRLCGRLRRSQRPASGRLQPNPPEFAAGYDLAPSPTSSILAVIDGTDVALLDGQSGKIVEVLKGDVSERPIENVSWSQDGKYVQPAHTASCRSGSSHPAVISVLQGYHGSAGLAWMPDGRTLVGMISESGELEAVNSATGKAIFTLEGFGSYSSNFTGPKWDGETRITSTAGEGSDPMGCPDRTGHRPFPCSFTS